MDLGVFLGMGSVFIELSFLVILFVVGLFTCLVLSLNNPVILPVGLVIAIASSVFISPRYNNAAANGFESLKSRTQVVDKNYFTAEKLVGLADGTRQVVNYCLDLELKAISSSDKQKNVVTCSATNKDIIFSNFNEKNFEKIKSEVAKSEDSKNSAYRDNMELLIKQAAKSVTEIKSLKDADDVNLFFSEGFKPIKPYILKIALDNLIKELQALDLTTKTGLDRFKVIADQAKTNCFSFDEASCSKIKNSLAEIKSKFDNYNAKEELKAIKVQF